ncbi:MAG: NADPH-dependent F420 reductase [Stellaceae bacterium]
MKIAFVGYGQVGSALADHLQRLGHDVMLAARDQRSDSVRKARTRNPNLRAVESREAVGTAEVVFLATPFQANADALQPVSADLKGKVLVDCTNPIGPGLSHGLKSAQSGSEATQALVSEAKLVKAFTIYGFIYGFENFENNSFPAYTVKPVMMFCGRDAAAKATVGGLIAELGWEPLDVGGLEQALHLEHMTLLYIRMVRMHGQPAATVWARLTR